MFKALSRLIVNAGGVSEETWKSYTQSQKRKYIKEHPNSIYAQKQQKIDIAKKVKKYQNAIKELKELKTKYKRKSNLDKIDAQIKKLRAKVAPYKTEYLKLKNKLDIYYTPNTKNEKPNNEIKPKITKNVKEEPKEVRLKDDKNFNVEKDIFSLDTRDKLQKEEQSYNKEDLLHALKKLVRDLPESKRKKISEQAKQKLLDLKNKDFISYINNWDMEKDWYKDILKTVSPNESLPKIKYDEFKDNMGFKFKDEHKSQMISLFKYGVLPVNKDYNSHFESYYDMAEDIENDIKDYVNSSPWLKNKEETAEEFVDCIFNGQPIKEAAYNLKRTPDTVRNVIYKICRKIRTKNVSRNAKWKRGEN